ncbi:MAG: hypothetical protein ACOX52_12215 [Verrucomicrobiota bacterium]
MYGYVYGYGYEGLPICQIIVLIGVGVGIGIAPRPVWHLAFLDRSNFAAKWCQHQNNTVARPGFSMSESHHASLRYRDR